ncbi:transport and Golgi organization protein 11 [Anabrus simplex]|uniref:transport and Golgi organization protein 11 n=1 Tax=Anabrus simplex TaxID=316456 RepID=UPI0034DD9E9A
MSKSASPTRISVEMDHFYDPNFTADISQKMRVPKRIKVTGADDFDTANYNNTLANEKLEKFDMHVPDRILVIGQDQHIGTKAPPRELVLEESVMPRDPGIVRVQTPPRVITLDNHFFPSADEEPELNPGNPEEKMVAVARPSQRVDPRLCMATRESTPPICSGGEGLTTAEELAHLRRQMVKLNRRIMAVELDNLQRQQREKVLCALGVAYFVIKALLWMSRTS